RELAKHWLPDCSKGKAEKSAADIRTIAENDRDCASRYRFVRAALPSRSGEADWGRILIIFEGDESNGNGISFGPEAVNGMPFPSKKDMSRQPHLDSKEGKEGQEILREVIPRHLLVDDTFAFLPCWRELGQQGSRRFRTAGWSLQ